MTYRHCKRKRIQCLCGPSTLRIHDRSGASRRCFQNFLSTLLASKVNNNQNFFTACFLTNIISHHTENRPPAFRNDLQKPISKFCWKCCYMTSSGVRSTWRKMGEVKKHHVWGKMRWNTVFSFVCNFVYWMQVPQTLFFYPFFYSFFYPFFLLSKYKLEILHFTWKLF